MALTDSRRWQYNEEEEEEEEEEARFFLPAEEQVS